MVKNKNNNIIFLVIILIVLVVIYIIFNYSKEGFYSNNDTSNAKSEIDDLLSNKMNNFLTTISDINSNKFTLDVTSSISSLGKDMPNITPNSKMYIIKKKNELSNIQKNLNKINDSMLAFVGNSMVEQLVNITDEKSSQKIPILDAITRANNALKQISKELSEIPE